MDTPLRLVELCKEYGRGQSRKAVVSDLSLHIRRGEILALLGPNGAGKTTTIKMCCNLVFPTRGTVYINGHDLVSCPNAAGENVGAVLEGSRNLFWRWSAEENLTYFAGLRGVPRAKVRPRIRELSERLSFSSRLRQPVQTLSRGNQQRIAFACALIAEPSLVLLDEPTLGLDFESQLSVREEVRRLAASGCAILLTTHQLELASALADTVGIIIDGSLAVCGPQTEVLKPLIDRARGYRIVFDGPPCTGATAVLSAWEACPADGESAYEVCLPEPGDVYRLIGELAPYEHGIKSLAQAMPTLVDVYMTYVGGKAG